MSQLIKRAAISLVLLVPSVLVAVGSSALAADPTKAGDLKAEALQAAGTEGKTNGRAEQAEDSKSTSPKERQHSLLGQMISNWEDLGKRSPVVKNPSAAEKKPSARGRRARDESSDRQTALDSSPDSGPAPGKETGAMPADRESKPALAEKKEQEKDDASKKSTNRMMRKTPRMTKRGDSPKDDKAKDLSKKDEAPTVPDRPIPGPEMKPKGSALDEDLLKDLGENLDGVEQQESEDPLMRAGQRMRTAEEQLARLDGEGALKQTRSLQDLILQDLEKVLEQKQNNNNQNNQDKNKNKDKEKQKQKQRQQQQMQQQMAQQQQQQQQQLQRSQQNEPAERAMKGRVQKENLGRDPEVKDVWGHLGTLFRDEMSQHAKENFLPKYREQLEQYYSRIAEESRPDVPRAQE